MDKVEQCGARGMATNLVQLLGIRMLEFESPVWMQSPTFRGLDSECTKLDNM